MYNFLSENNLLSPNQSRFRLGGPCIDQLLSINRESLNIFDKGLDFRGISPDISKAFDKVLLDGLIFKLCQNGISWDTINILRKFLCNKKQWVVLNGQCSSWADVRAGVYQKLILWTFDVLDIY